MHVRCRRVQCIESFVIDDIYIEIADPELFGTQQFDNELYAMHKWVRCAFDSNPFLSEYIFSSIGFCFGFFLSVSHRSLFLLLLRSLFSHQSMRHGARCFNSGPFIHFSFICISLALRVNARLLALSLALCLSLSRSVCTQSDYIQNRSFIIYFSALLSSLCCHLNISFVSMLIGPGRVFEWKSQIEVSNGSLWLVYNGNANNTKIDCLAY